MLFEIKSFTRIHMLSVIIVRYSCIMQRNSVSVTYRFTSIYHVDIDSVSAQYEFTSDNQIDRVPTYIICNYCISETC